MKTIDLGNGYTARWFPWAPDRKLNPQYADVPDIEHSLLEVKCPHGNRGACHPDTPEVRRVFTTGPYWQLVSLDPLHIEPSIQFMRHDKATNTWVNGCCHGFIRNGQWVPA